jgi:murein DD-endopeptidase MepM/ murein hydrolase activator NlpD
MHPSSYQKLTKISFYCLVFLLFFGVARAETIDELNKKIDQQKDVISELDKEIESHRKELNKVSTQANTLQNTVNSLTNTEKKLDTSIKRTNADINKTELTIQKINLEIEDKETQIKMNKEAMADLIVQENNMSRKSLFEKILTYNTLSEFWRDIDRMIALEIAIKEKNDSLMNLNKDLKNKEGEKINEKENLTGLKEEYTGQKESVLGIKSEKSKILKETKNQEANYQVILKEKLAQKEAFERELLNYETQLKTIVNSKDIPDKVRGVLSWPLSNIRITQLFGGTQFAKNNPNIYGRAFHNGVDFGVPMGDPVKAVADGTVLGWDNTDKNYGCYSWGMWLVVKHESLNLGSLYAHLSSVIVKPGQQVKAGQIIAYSGSSGISTGPHLHLTIYSDQGLEIKRIKDFNPATKCGDATIPVAPLDAYLDPMDYLPKL